MKIQAPLVIALCLISFSAHANNNYNRPYIGVGLGAMQQFNKYSDTINVFVQGTPAVDVNMNKSGNNSTRAPVGNLNIGYSKLISSKVYLAAEAQAFLRPYKNSYNTNIVSRSGNVILTTINSVHSVQQLSPGVAMALKHGMLLSPGASVYGILGAEIARFKVAYQADLSIAGVPETASGAKSTTRYGLLLGFGLDSYINNKLRIGLEYNYVDYGKIPAPEPAIHNSLRDLLALGKPKIQAHTLLVKLTYDL
jgi:hypothetical protein